jgi:TPR repeat protein
VIQASRAAPSVPRGTGVVAATRERLARAVRAGDRSAMFELGLNLLVSEPAAPQTGVGLLKVAASRGEAAASHLCAVIAAQDVQTERNWDIALDYLALAAEQGSIASQRQLLLLAGQV